MNCKEKFILSKLADLAGKQQKIIYKLARESTSNITIDGSGFETTPIGWLNDAGDSIVITTRAEGRHTCILFEEDRPRAQQMTPSKSCHLSYTAPGLIGQSPSSLYLDRKSTRLNSSHQIISYAVFCLKKKNNKTN